MEGYFAVSLATKKIEGPYPTNLVDPVTGKPFSPDENTLVVAPPDYPQLAEGLEIGALYRDVPGPDGRSGILHELGPLDEYYDWCEKLASFVTNGKRLKERPNDKTEWSNKLSELVVDKKGYPKTEGRGPFWELFRYGMRGMTFGPAVCKKLADDFINWGYVAQASGDSHFSFMCDHIGSAFYIASESGTGMVRYPWQWTQDMEPKLGIEKVAKLKFHNHRGGTVTRLYYRASV
ncbi:hypothetical protein B0G80_7554 [Paraburkholderia sp. BL6669N2]|uniref:hypothetical protein n=1 Tax=Paraburkholderia sp. BL6669N2 TaxID=1938807 RepID=UPI000E25334D|nr:hypothetical protein [Paraburkholderia sp. BL6669N2]REG51070.1 hypothetical protein B0G80_7554 [Paraburkholderia sp. BL6669N2]